MIGNPGVALAGYAGQVGDQWERDGEVISYQYSEGVDGAAGVTIIIQE